MKLTHFKEIGFLQAIKGLFKELKVPMNYVADEPTSAQEILKDTYKDNSTFALVDDVYFVGMVDDAAFENNESLATDKIKSDYDGVLIFGVTLHLRENNLLPTRSQLAEISRAFNREFYYTPVVLVYKYKDDSSNYIAFANTERLQYKQTWREGEKAGKVSLLRDINIENPHRGHEDIINQLKIPISGKNQVDSFVKLYSYWQEVFNVNLLNKKFYQELSNWYFWAIKHVTFPNQPTKEDAHNKKVELTDLIQEHNAKNVIRMLTRLLFTWFIKEKKLIPEELFNLDALQQDILNEISPYHDENSLFSDANQDSVYYKAILQNLFFASLNCPINSDGVDNRKRGFRGLETYGKHRGIDWMMRYKTYFKNPDKFLEMMNETVPFLNGGLFECLDDKTQNLYIDGFSDQMTKGEKLIVPDYLFFGVEEKVDLSTDYGVKNKKAKEAAVKGLINILKSYKFTITENTPIEEDVALDPELLGKVFENLLASYNPETKTTARKQTGSFYTPREIVNYMVDESLIAYLKTEIDDWNLEKDKVDEYLHQLFSFDATNPFSENENIQKKIIKALDKCTILDPACGSGAFPMGTLQKMVHVLGKLDSNNAYWQDIQLEKAQKETDGVFSILDKKEREQQLLDINEAFDEALNHPDYARKLYLIENCIYGVDIQSIATQISKLRFFISLVVDQKINSDKENFGIRPLPNLETKFVAANTLIRIKKPTTQTNLFDTKEVKKLEKELKVIRHKLFSAKTKDTKLKYRQKDESLRNAIATQLKNNGWSNDTAEKLASWDPYDQNASSSFFDPEWMFDNAKGFNIVIGNPPYKLVGSDEKKEQNYFKANYRMASYKINLYVMFLELGLNILSDEGVLSYIIPKSLVFNTYLKETRNILLSEYSIPQIVEINGKVFENAEVGDNIVFFGQKKKNNLSNSLKYMVVDDVSPINIIKEYHNEQELLIDQHDSNFYDKIKISSDNTSLLSEIAILSNGLNPGNVKHILLSNSEDSDRHKKMLLGRDIKKYQITWSGTWVNYDKNLKNTIKVSDIRSKSGMTSQKKVDFALRKESIYSPKKILIRKTSDQIIASYDTIGYYFDSLAYSIQLNDSEDISIYYLLGVLNSKLMSFVHESMALNKGKAFAKVLIKNLAQLPIYIIDFENKFESMIHSTISQVVNFQLYKTLSSENNASFENIIDALVFELYFNSHIKKREIAVLKFVERDIEKITNGRDFDSLKDSDKKVIVEQLLQTWSHPDNEVRNRIKLFAVRSPEILKPILES
ncbi:Eco57I restriction-modification methylase domain-containing protein [Tenacibaculum maritimum]|uniref:Eco57I restriction-modification methylase domain-containing protein n=1 Tax=Tenacibaculum maritimum TaxID=107401 RepID=UPI0012E5F2C0|nr:TaqI-like C-terminal specificity domain-containing protein [Tenacibaculum maritimum]CAA0225778.1 putative restriction-modification methylase [Tenacibaculum maritimum]